MSIIEEFYRLYQDTCDYIGHDSTTSDIDLIKAAKHFKIKKFKGVFPADRLPRLKAGECAIMNTDVSTGPGVHWLAVYCINKSKIAVYDSFGRHIDSLVPMTFFGKGITVVDDVEHDSEQLKQQSSCGQFSLSFLRFVCLHGIKNALTI